MGSVESSHSWGHSWVHRCFFRMSKVNYLLNRLFHFKIFSKLFIIQGGKVRVFFDYSGGKRCAQGYLFICLLESCPKRP